MKKIVLFSVAALSLALCACTAAPAQPEVDQPEAAHSEAEVTPQAQASDNESFFASTREYILYGQDNQPEAARLYWSEAYLDAVDFESAYAAYLADGGEAGDSTAFAAYLTDNAVAPANWQELFEQSLMEEYSQTAARYEEFEPGIYQVYVELDGAEVPFVTVDSRTGWYHG